MSLLGLAQGCPARHAQWICHQMGGPELDPEAGLCLGFTEDSSAFWDPCKEIFDANTFQERGGGVLPRTRHRAYSDL